MGIIPFLDVLGRELDFADLMIAALAGQRDDLKFVSLHRNHVKVIQVNGIAGVSDDRAHVTGQKIFFFANAKHERTAAASADHEIRDIRVNQGDAVCADDLLKRGANGAEEPRFFPGSVHRARA